MTFTSPDLFLLVRGIGLVPNVTDWECQLVFKFFENKPDYYLTRSEKKITAIYSILSSLFWSRLTCWLMYLKLSFFGIANLLHATTILSCISFWHIMNYIHEWHLFCINLQLNHISSAELSIAFFYCLLFLSNKLSYLSCQKPVLWKCFGDWDG